MNVSYNPNATNSTSSSSSSATTATPPAVTSTGAYTNVLTLSAAEIADVTSTLIPSEGAANLEVSEWIYTKIPLNKTHLTGDFLKSTLITQTTSTGVAGVNLTTTTTTLIPDYYVYALKKYFFPTSDNSTGVSKNYVADHGSVLPYSRIVGGVDGIYFPTLTSTQLPKVE